MSINTSNGVLNRVPVDRYSINFIRFPEKANEFGSSVSFKIDSAKNRAMFDGKSFRSRFSKQIAELIKSDTGLIN